MPAVRRQAATPPRTAAVCQNAGCGRSIAVYKDGGALLHSQSRRIFLEPGKPPVVSCRHCGKRTAVVWTGKLSSN